MKKAKRVDQEYPNVESNLRFLKCNFSIFELPNFFKSIGRNIKRILVLC